jgi:ribonuclease HIII
MEEKNCSFQYSVTYGNFYKVIDIVENQTEITLSKCKELWNKYYNEAVKHIKNGDSIEMCIWINMIDKYSFGEKLHHISGDVYVESGYIVETVKKYFPKELK